MRSTAKFVRFDHPELKTRFLFQPHKDGDEVDAVDLAAATLVLAFFAAAIGSYVLHGVLRDTDNQLRRPHVLGTGTVAPALMSAFMWALMAAEIGGFAVLFAGALRAL